MSTGFHGRGGCYGKETGIKGHESDEQEKHGRR
jgi:hypothetical protein